MEAEEYAQNLKNAKSHIEKMDEFIQNLVTPAFEIGTVVRVVDPLQARKVAGKSVTDPFKAGDRVLLDPASRWFNQCLDKKGKPTEGVVLRRDPDMSKGWVRVKWDGGNTNAYPDGSDARTMQEEGVHLLHAGSRDGMFKNADGYEVPSVIVSLRGDLSEVLAPRDLPLKPGDMVRIHAESKQIVGTLGKQLQPKGELAFYAKDAPDGCLVELDGKSLIVNPGAFEGQLKRGDRVVLCGARTIIIANLGREDQAPPEQGKAVNWEDIGGLEKVKEAVQEAVELPRTNPEIFKAYGKKPAKGILLYGPPGCGKTLIGKAIATSLMKSSGGSSPGFIYVKATEILDRFVGVGEAKVRALFDAAREHKERTGQPAVIFVDEADAILSRRGSGMSSDMEKTIVPTFLTEMDGLSESAALVVLATNRADALDEAVIRDGRIDRKIRIERPDRQGASQILKINLKTIPSKDLNDEALMDEIFDDQKVLYHLDTDAGRIDFCFSHLLDGAMLAGIVDRAVGAAMQRDIKAGKKKPTGVQQADLSASIQEVFEQSKLVPNFGAIKDFLEAKGRKAAAVSRPGEQVNLMSPQGLETCQVGGNA